MKSLSALPRLLATGVRAPALRCYTFAAVVCMFALLPRFAFGPLFGDVSFLAPWFIAILLSTWYGDWRAGLFATGFGALLAGYLLIPPFFSFHTNDANGAVHLGLFVLAGGMISLLGGALRVAIARSEQQAMRLADLLVELRTAQSCLEQDIARHKKMETALAHSQAQLAGIIDSAMDAIITVDANHTIIRWNTAAERIFQCPAAEVIGQPLDRFLPQRYHDLPSERARTFGGAEITTRMMGEQPPMAQRADGSEFPIEASVSQVTVDGQTLSTVILRDITVRYEAETTHRRLETQLLHAQKMECVGQLAGGVAHDFNNLLTAITGYTELVLSELPPHEHVRTDLYEIQKAVDRATSLTRQLLAFARRQRIEPRVMNLNDLILEMERFLGRLIGEDIALVILPAANLANVKIDPGQIEQVLANLVVNARDAMPQGGKLSIETANVTLDSCYAQGHLDVAPGPYVMLAVGDDGIGMPPEVQAHLFEPFFTTKEQGRGTGLGLSTCYGIVKQHGGTIWVYSEVGRGTIVKVYLPQVFDPVPALTADLPEMVLPQGAETVLVVEDETLVRSLIVRVLRSCGYTVLEATNGEDALAIARRWAPSALHLLLSDVVMPQQGGRLTAEEIQVLYPSIKVLFMSGYTGHTTVQHGYLEAGSPFLQKPFTPSALASKVREVLDGG